MFQTINQYFTITLLTDRKLWTPLDDSGTGNHAIEGPFPIFWWNIETIHVDSPRPTLSNPWIYPDSPSRKDVKYYKASSHWGTSICEAPNMPYIYISYIPSIFASPLQGSSLDDDTGTDDALLTSRSRPEKIHKIARFWCSDFMEISWWFNRHLYGFMWFNAEFNGTQWDLTM